MKQIISKILLTFTLLATAFISSYAEDSGQNARQGRNDGWRLERIAFLTKEMNLTQEQAQVFWPVYNKIENEKNKAFQDMLDAFRALEEAVAQQKNEKTLTALTEAYLEAVAKTRDIDRKYIDEYRKVISPEQIAKLYIGEENFRREQINRLHKPKD